MGRSPSGWLGIGYFVVQRCPGPPIRNVTGGHLGQIYTVFTYGRLAGCPGHPPPPTLRLQRPFGVYLVRCTNKRQGGWGGLCTAVALALLLVFNTITECNSSQYKCTASEFPYRKQQLQLMPSGYLEDLSSPRIVFQNLYKWNCKKRHFWWENLSRESTNGEYIQVGHERNFNVTWVEETQAAPRATCVMFFFSA